MNILELLAPSRAEAAAPLTSKKRVLEHAARLVERELAAGTTGNDADTAPVSSLQIFEALLARERLGSTALGDGVAVPHCRLAACPRPLAVLLTLAEGVDFDAPDNQPVRLVFVLVVPEEATNEHIALLANIAALLNDSARRNQLLAARDGDELLAAIRAFEPGASGG